MAADNTFKGVKNISKIMIKIDNFSFEYGKKRILNDINLELHKNEITVVLGPNGSGKTTLIKAIARLSNIKNGHISINDKNIKEYDRNELAKIISYMPQMRHVPNMSVRDFVVCARYPYLGFSKIPNTVDFDIVDKVLDIVGMKEFAHRHLKKLSGGERQKVYFAFMLAQNTEVLLLDEPSTYLDVTTQFEILDLINKLKNNKSVIMVLHDICQGLKIADKVVIMDKGKVVFCGKPEDAIGQKIFEKTYGVKIHKVKLDGKEEYMIGGKL